MDSSLNNEILEILENDAKVGINDLAAMTGASAEAVQKAIEKLENDKIIVKYSAVINWERVDSDEAEALIEVKVVPKRGLGYDDLAERIYRFNRGQIRISDVRRV